MSIVWLFAILVVAAVVMRMVRPSARPPGDGHGVDRDELEAAEREVQDLDALTSADDADDQMHDWGPGAPR